MLRLPISAAAVFLASLAGCNPLQPNVSVRVITVEHHRVECMGPWEQLCLLIQSPPTSALTRHYGAIEGFEYEWGYRYNLEVVDRRIANPPADGSSIRTSLRRVLSKERVPSGTDFALILTGGAERVVEVAPNRYRFYDDAEFVCSSGEACENLQPQISAGARVRYFLEHPAQATDPLVLRSWQVCTEGGTGSIDC
jgi:hypothetical protein